MSVSNEEKAAVYMAMAYDFRGTGIGITIRMATYLRLESVICRRKPLNAYNVVLWLVVRIIGLLVASDLR